MTKTAQEFYNNLVEKFPFEPTISQDSLLSKLTDFILENNNNVIFIIKGYAGTGKTTMISNYLLYQSDAADAHQWVINARHLNFNTNQSLIITY